MSLDHNNIKTESLFIYVLIHLTNIELTTSYIDTWINVERVARACIKKDISPLPTLLVAGKLGATSNRIWYVNFGHAP